MLSKEEFCKYVNTYKEFQDYIDKLDKLNIKLWETEMVGRYIDYYVTMVSRLMKCEPDEKYGTIVENFLFNSDNIEEEPEKFYDKFVEDKNEQNITTVKAIPIEWIKKQIEKWKSWSPEGLSDDEWEYGTCLETLLENWEKENG